MPTPVFPGSWVSVDEVIDDWPDAPAFQEGDPLGRLVEAAQDQCARFAPILAVDTPVPARYRQAVILQARELFSAARREGDVIGFEAYGVRVRPLGSTVKALLRPPRGGVKVR